MSMMMDVVRDGMAKSSARPMQILGEMLTDWLLKHPAEAERAVDDKKTLAGAMSAIEDVARKQGGKCGVVDDQEALRIALAYLGVKGAEPTGDAHKPAAADTFALDNFWG